jgi:ribonucleotide reductase alpha subunit
MPKKFGQDFRKSNKTGNPYILYKDQINKKKIQKKYYKSSNLCCEITFYIYSKSLLQPLFTALLKIYSKKAGKTSI